MSKVYALILACLVSSCGVPWPENPGAKEPAGTSLAVGLTVQFWSEHFPGIEFPPPPPISWFQGECLEYDELEEPYECTIGMYLFNCFDEEIHIIAEATPSSTALTHELLHWALHQSGTVENGDPDHQHPLWKEVKVITQILKDEDL